MEFNLHHGSNYPMLSRLSSHMESSGWGVTVPESYNWLLGTKNDSIPYPRKDSRGRFGFSVYSGYEFMKNWQLGATGGYTSLGSVEGHTIDDSYLKLAMDQWYIIPIIRYQPLPYLDLSGGIGITGNRSTIRNTDLPITTYTSHVVSSMLSTELILRPEHFKSYWKIGVGYMYTRPSEIGPYEIDSDTNFPRLRLGFNYLMVRITILGLSF
jgi:hypothetical protein